MKIIPILWIIGAGLLMSGCATHRKICEDLTQEECYRYYNLASNDEGSGLTPEK